MTALSKIKSGAVTGLALVGFTLGFIICLLAGLAGFALAPVMESFKGGVEEGRAWWGFDQ